MVVLITTYLLLVFLVPVVVSGLVSYRSLPRTAECPQCTRDTALLRPRGGRAGSAMLRGLGLQRRWCLHCSWDGLTRRVAARPVAEPVIAVVEDVVQVLDVRSLRLDGRTWRVQLQCWEVERVCHGRLVFVDAAGRPWPDALQAFTAPTALGVLSQALSIPDRALASRLRQLMMAE